MDNISKYPKNSLSDLIENGNDEYDSYYDLPYEAQQALRNYSYEYPFGDMRIHPRFLIDDFGSNWNV